MSLAKKAKKEAEMDNRYQFSDYNAASLVLQNLESIYTDMIENNGL